MINIVTDCPIDNLRFGNIYVMPIKQIELNRATERETDSTVITILYPKVTPTP